MSMFSLSSETSRELVTEVTAVAIVLLRAIFRQDSNRDGSYAIVELQVGRWVEVGGFTMLSSRDFPQAVALAPT